MYMKRFVLNKRLFLCIVITGLLKALPTSFPFLKHLPHFLPPQSSNEPLSGPLLSGLRPFCCPSRAVWCRCLYHMNSGPRLTACGELPHQSPRSKVRAPAVILAGLQRMTADGEGVSTGRCVQRSSLLPCWVPGVRPFMDIMCFFSISLLCILGELAYDASAAKTGDRSSVNWEG